MTANVSPFEDTRNSGAFLKLWITIWLPLVAFTIPAMPLFFRLNRWFAIIFTLESICYLVVSAFIGRQHRRKLADAPLLHERGHILPNISAMRRRTLIWSACVVLLLLNTVAMHNETLPDRMLISAAVLAPPFVIWLILRMFSSRRSGITGR